MNFGELIYKRRSVRGFTGQALNDEQIKILLNAATNAPNACNYQSWHFFCVKNKDMIEGFFPEVYSGEWIKTAGAVFVVCTNDQKISQRFGNRGKDLFAIQDTACAADHLLLMASELGLAGCFVGAFDEDKCREYLNIPQEWRPVIILPIGYAAAEAVKRPRCDIEDVCTILK